MTLVTQVLQHNWYAVAVLVVTLGTQYVKTHHDAVWAKFPVGWRFGLPAVGAMAAAFLHAWALGEPWKQALLDVGNSLWQIATPAMGVAAVLKESHLPWDGGAGGAPKLIALSTSPLPANVVPISHASSEDDRVTPVDAHVAAGRDSLPPTDPPPPDDAA